MKFLLKLTLSLFLLFAFAHAQQRDPHSTPPGAPLFEQNPGDVIDRLVPNHPGNAGQRVAVSNFVIIESQSFNPGHNMDAQWLSVVTGMGHTASVMQQTTLNSNAFFATTDALIVSSGVIGLSAGAVTIIRQFLQTGKSVYLQGEYQTTYATNQAFQTIMNGTGGTFSLGGTVAGDLAPCSVLNNYATTTNAVPSIGYHWYGATGSGCNNLEYFMRWSGNNLGYVYCPTNASYGDMIQNTDQDWIRSGTSIPLMQNMVYALLNGNACSVVCGTILDAQHLEVEANVLDNGAVQLDWQVDGLLNEGEFEILANDQVISDFAVQGDEQTHFQWIDQNHGSGMQHYAIRYLNANGQVALTGETMIDLGTQPAKLYVATEKDGFRVWLNEAYQCATLSLIDVAGRRQTLENLHMTGREGQFLSMAHLPSGIYWLEGETTQHQPLHAKLAWTR